jgi:uncharacterized membrane protein
MGNRSDGSWWTAAPPSSLIFFQKPYGLDFKAFWIITHGIHELIFITALIFNWKIRKRRNLILLVLAGHIAVRVWTLLYFAPTIIGSSNYRIAILLMYSYRKKPLNGAI